MVSLIFVIVKRTIHFENKNAFYFSSNFGQLLYIVVVLIKLASYYSNFGLNYFMIKIIIILFDKLDRY